MEINRNSAAEPLDDLPGPKNHINNLKIKKEISRRFSYQAALIVQSAASFFAFFGLTSSFGSSFSFFAFQTS